MIEMNEVIKLWLDEKESLSGSARTRKNYVQVIEKFRERLRGIGRSLDPHTWADRNDPEAWQWAMTQFAAETREFASFSWRTGERVSANTFKTRLAIVTSFYQFAIGTAFRECLNPASRVKPPKSHAYEKSRPIPIETIVQGVQSIDCTRIKGRRDRAILATLFGTSRRVSEVLALRWKHVEVLGGPLQSWRDVQDLRLRLTFEHCKGGKNLRHILTPLASRTVLECVAATYGAEMLLFLDPERPLWTNLSGKKSMDLEPLGYEGVRCLCRQVLGTTRVHDIRHAVALACKNAGMELWQIMEFLGHSNLATTQRYLGAVAAGGENPMGEELETTFGFRGHAEKADQQNGVGYFARFREE